MNLKLWAIPLRIGAWFAWKLGAVLAHNASPWLLAIGIASLPLLMLLPVFIGAAIPIFVAIVLFYMAIYDTKLLAERVETNLSKTWAGEKVAEACSACGGAMHSVLSQASERAHELGRLAIKEKASGSPVLYTKVLH